LFVDHGTVTRQGLSPRRLLLIPSATIRVCSEELNNWMSEKLVPRHFPNATIRVCSEELKTWMSEKVDPHHFLNIPNATIRVYSEEPTNWMSEKLAVRLMWSCILEAGV